MLILTLWCFAQFVVRCLLKVDLCYDFAQKFALRARRLYSLFSSTSIKT
jgi:hypothetical protein